MIDALDDTAVATASTIDDFETKVGGRHENWLQLDVETKIMGWVRTLLSNLFSTRLQRVIIPFMTLFTRSAIAEPQYEDSEKKQNLMGTPGGRFREIFEVG